MRSCLKHETHHRLPPLASSSCPSSPPTRPKCRKSVSFRGEGADVDEVHTADEWDRTPVEAARNLSYQDILELKEMQISVAKSSMSPLLCSHVPVGLLPLLADTPSPSPSSASSSSSPSYPFPASRVRSPPSPPTTPPRPKVTSIPAPPPRARFAFLPLVDQSTFGSAASPTSPKSPPNVARVLPTINKPASPTMPPSPPLEHPGSTRKPPTSYFPPHPVSSSSSSSFPYHYSNGSPSTMRPPPQALSGNSIPNHLKSSLRPLPSPQLLPPSPFSLYPPSPPLEPERAQGGGGERR